MGYRARAPYVVVAAAAATLLSCAGLASCGSLSFNSVESAPPDAAPSEALLWNFWAVDAATAREVEAIAPGDDLQLVVDLSTVFSGQLSSPLSASEALTGALQRLRAIGMATTTLNLLVVPDPLAFEGEPASASLGVDLEKLEVLLARRAAGELPSRVDGLAGSAPYSVGRVAVDLRVRAGASGAAPVVLSVWRGDWSEPIDEVAVVLDVGGPRPILGGGRSLALGALDGPQPGGGPPDAAIHFVAGDGARPVHALFRERDAAPGTFAHWRLGAGGEPVTGAQLTEELTAIAQTIGTAGSGDVLLQEGRVLHDLLFPGRAAGVLDAFLAGRTSKPSLLVRMLDPARSGPIAVPLAFIRRSARPPTEQGGFLGDELRLETPLAVRPRAPAPGCLSSWAILLPPPTSDAAMSLLRSEIGAGRVPPGLLPSWGRSSIAPNDRIAGFREWLTRDAATGPSVLLIASHQAQDTFSFGAGALPEARFDVRNFRRTFSSPSIAILAGCGTGGPEASRILRRLNRQGFTTIIATSTPANGGVLGRFLRLLSEEIAAGSGQPIGPTFDRALLKLREDTSAGRELAPRALQITLLGDRTAPICPPR